jgi:hypothetical protein
MRLRRNILAPPVRAALLTLRCDWASSPDPCFAGLRPAPLKLLVCWLEILTVNRRAAWTDKSENQAFASSDTRIIVYQTSRAKLSAWTNLNTIPCVSEHQLPTGNELAPPAQIIADELIPDLLYVGRDDELVRRKLESKG